MSDQGLLSESDLVRTPEYWARLEVQLRGAVAARAAEFKAAYGLPADRDLFKLVIATGGARTFPSTRLLAEGNLEIIFPIDYFKHMDQAAIWMSLYPPFRQSVGLVGVFPRDDHSTFFHWTWSYWILLHEIGHFACGHLDFIAGRVLTEFPAIDERDGTAEGVPLALRRAMEIDADAFAARALFRAYASMSSEGYWTKMYGGREDAASIAMQDLALVLWPLFLELDYASPETPTTHPTAFERFVLLETLGFGVYAKYAGSHAGEHLGSFQAGLRKAMQLTCHLPGAIYKKKVPQVDLLAHWRELKQADMQSRRRFPLGDDWIELCPQSEQAH